ncbi:MAG: Ribonuclease HII [Candidatus Woesebacteria bacterium GW2011_GWA2_40_7]|uniref:Ribonuclease n=3 Tax=Candidatus Woeseibacteriota TaxID=1752722 RepID=A0A0G0UY54_9BACT|nr:MAG: Ribonuclease HII [Candidatus Woesebacteria bacterium GW2011_GWB1_39_10]KKR73415.1 MAG: Ribonuclease HII [Candidatus Woesebacteria bacterium GW2011_GWA2_40_7]KKR92456.1 MAG: Ribonuclease HII [Candidatus Woesebacteria bacterium GW2011_GWA1_41_13b]
MTLPDFSFEKKLWNKGFKVVAGMDEVGRGCFAGAIVAGCVVFDRNTITTFKDTVLKGNRKIIINDSKQLTPRQRKVADKWIRQNALAIGIGQASVAQINRFGIKKASEIAFRKAIKSVSIKVSSIEYLLIDAFFIPYVRSLRRKNQKAIIKGDTKSISIAAASIVAKVYRDKLMVKISKNPKFRVYKWGKNKGYGTKEHQNAIKKYGATKLHRKAFVATWLNKLKVKSEK